MEINQISNEIKVLRSLVKVYDAIKSNDSEMDCRYKWVNEITVNLWRYTEQDYSVESDYCDIVIYDLEKNPIIIIETKALDKEGEESVLKQLLGYAKSTTRFLIGTNISNVWVWEINPKNKKYTLRVKINLEDLKKVLEEKNKFEINLTSHDIQQLLFFFNLRKFIMYDQEIYKDFNILYHKVRISEPKGFEHLIFQTSRIINEILMEYSLRTFDIYYSEFEDYLKMRETIEKKKNECKNSSEFAILERSLMKLNKDYEAFKNFGYEAWKIYSGKMRDKHEDNKILFCKETIYVLLNKILFIRISEDKGLIKPHLSNGGIETLRDFITKDDQKYKSVINFAFDNAKNVYSHFYEPGILDWYVSGNGELDKLLNRTLWILNQFDFSDVNQDILGNLYEKYLPKEERKAFGEFYTPTAIINYILDSIGYKGSEIRGKKLIDPACGSGGFLIQAIKRLIDSFLKFLNKKSVEELSPKEASEILSATISNINGWDLNPFACHIAEMNILFQLIDLIKIAKKSDSFDFKRIKIFHTDSLIKSLAQTEKRTLTYYIKMDESVKIYADEQKIISKMKEAKYDFVVGNPPYVHLTSIPNDLYKIYKASYPTVAIGRTDLYILFLKLGIDLLRDEGKLGYIVSNQFLVKGAGDGIKKQFLNRTKILEITDFHQFGQFLDATNYTAITILQKCSKENERNSNYIRYNYVKEKTADIIDALKTKSSNQITSLDIEQQGLNFKEKWKYVSSTEDHIIKRIKDYCNTTIKDIGGKSKSGVNTGNDSIFIGKIGSKTESEEIVNFIPLIEIQKRSFKEFPIEKSTLRKLGHGRNIKRYSKIQSDKVVIFYYLQNKGKTEVIPLVRLKKEFPNCYNYIIFYKELIGSRTISREKKFGDTPQWHQLTRPRDLKIYRKGEILTPSLNNYPNFTLNSDETVYVGGTAGVYGIIFDDKKLVECKISREYILGLLNSSIYSYYFRQKGAVKRGGYYQLAGDILDTVPIIIPHTTKQENIKNKITKLVNERYLFEEKSNINNQIQNIYEQVELISLMNSDLVTQISDFDNLKNNTLSINSNVVNVGNGKIRCKNADIAQCIYLILRTNNWEDSETPSEDLLTLLIPKNENGIQFILDNIKKYYLEDENSILAKRNIDCEINNLVIKLFEFSDLDAKIIESEYVDPWK